MADLFGRDVKTIGKHINNAVREELSDQVVVAKFATTTQHGIVAGRLQHEGIIAQNRCSKLKEKYVVEIKHTA